MRSPPLTVVVALPRLTAGIREPARGHCARRFASKAFRPGAKGRPTSRFIFPRHTVPPSFVDGHQGGHRSDARSARQC